MAFQSVGGVSAPFVAVDESVESLTQVLERIASLQGALGRLSDAINSASRSIGSAADGITRAVGSMDRMAVVLASSAEVIRDFRVPSGGGRGGGDDVGGLEAGGGNRPLKFLRGTDEEKSNAVGQAIGYAALKSISEAMDENQALTQTLAAFNVPGLTGLPRQRDLDLLHEFARVSAVGTSYTEQETAQMMPGAVQMGDFTGATGIEKFAGVFPSALTMAEVGEVRGLGSIADNLKAAIGYADLTQRYNPGQLAPGLDEILAIAESTRTSLSSVEAVMKRGLPVAAATGTNIDQATEAIGYLMHAGLGQSAGSAVGRMILGALTTGAPTNVELRQGRATAAAAMGENVPQFRDMTAHVQALRNLGVANAAGRLTVLNAEGGVDLGKILADIRSYGAHHTSIDLAHVLHQAFGIQGMPDTTLRAVQQGGVADFKKLIAGMPGAVVQQAAFPATPLQQFEQLLARLQDIGNALATAVLPEMNDLLVVLVKVADVLDRFIPKHPMVAAGGGAAAAATIGFFLGGPYGAALGAIFGGAVGGYEAMPEGAPTPKAIPGQAEANAALLGRPREPQLANVTVNAPLTVTVQGDMLGDYANLSAFLTNWWQQNAGAVGESVKQKILRLQHQSRRSTMQDYGNEAVHSGGITIGGP